MKLTLLLLAVLLSGCESKLYKTPTNPCSQVIKSDCEIVFNGDFYAIRRIKDQLFYSHGVDIWEKDRPMLFIDSCEAKKTLLSEINYNKKKIFKPI